LILRVSGGILLDKGQPEAKSRMVVVVEEEEVVVVVVTN
jgi:hypothetical protein